MAIARVGKLGYVLFRDISDDMKKVAIAFGLVEDGMVFVSSQFVAWPHQATTLYNEKGIKFDLDSLKIIGEEGEKI